MLTCVEYQVERDAPSARRSAAANTEATVSAPVSGLHELVSLSAATELTGSGEDDQEPLRAQLAQSSAARACDFRCRHSRTLALPPL